MSAAREHITYTPRCNATPEGELNVLAGVYRFVLDRRAKKEAAPESRPEDARKDRRARTQKDCT